MQLTNLPPYYDCTKVTKLSLNQVAWWDEKYRKVQISSSLKKKQTQFRRNESGSLDPNCTIDPKKATLHVKFVDEVRFCFDVALVDGVGARLEPFDHDCKKIVLHSTFEKWLAKEQIVCKNLPETVLHRQPTTT